MPLYNPATTVTDATLSISDITTNNASTSAHGFLKKLDNISTNFMNGVGNWAAPGVSAAGLNAGTSNPGSPADGDLFHRTDLGLIIRYYSSGTTWRCVCPHTISVSNQHLLLPVSATNSVRAPMPQAITASIYMTTLDVGMYVTTTNNGSNYWTISYGATSVSTSASAADTVLLLSANINASSTIATDKWIQVDFTKTGTPGTGYPLVGIGFRYIAT